MKTQVIEVDEDLFQITTEHDDGSVTVDLYVGHDAYVKHSKAEREDGRTNQGRTSTASNHLGLWH